MSSNHDDWVSSVSMCGDLILSGKLYSLFSMVTNANIIILLSKAVMTTLSTFGRVTAPRCWSSQVSVMIGQCQHCNLFTLVIPGHTQPVKTVSWLSEQTFVSGGQDQVSVLIGQLSLMLCSDWLTLANAVF